MSTLSAEMEFEIGDFVYFKVADHDEGRVPRKFIIQERFVQQCHGGIQRLYKIGATADLAYVPGIALTKEKPPFEYTENMKRERAILKDQFLEEFGVKGERRNPRR